MKQDRGHNDHMGQEVAAAQPPAGGASPDPSGWTDFARPSGAMSYVSGQSDDFGFTAGPPPGIPPGTDLGGVTIVRLLGSGGMGCVYEARQHAPARSVAVKVMRDGAVSPTQLRRFEYEAEVLGRLEHPGIARVYLVGTARVGPVTVPYIVMELVPEARIVTRFCAESGWAARPRLELMRRICAAVAHGHQKGVIHRDLKPGNILVDAAGTAKVIDFGVARSTTEEHAPHTMLTDVGQVVGTLHYMSPEQLGGRCGDVDARSDVHALGLVLYELLVGSRPYDLRGRSPLEAAQMIVAAEPPIMAAVAEAVRSDRSISRDDARSLGAVVARCLEKRPEDRYQTAADVEAELGRWLAGEPVVARPPGLGRAVGRLARRHRVAATAAAGVLLAVVLAVVGIGAFALRAERSAAAARAQLYRATVLLAADARDRGAIDEAARLVGVAGELPLSDEASRPFELTCLTASLDESAAVLARHEGSVRATAWSPDGTLVAAATATGAVRLVPSGVAAPRSARGAAVLAGHGREVWCLAWSPDGRRLATASADESTKIWDVATGTELHCLRGHGGTVYGVAFSPDGKRLATGGRDGTARIWNADTAAQELVVGGTAGTVYAVCFSPDGAVLATASKDGAVRLWDAATAALQDTLVGPQAWAFSVCFSPAGDRLASAAQDGAVRIWDVGRSRVEAVLRHPFKANAAAFVDGGRHIVTVTDDCLVRWWDVDTQTEIARRHGHAGGIWSIAAAPDGRWLATGADDATVRLWSTDFACDPVVDAGGKIVAAASDPRGMGVALGTDEGIAFMTLPDVRLAARRQAAGRRVNDLCFFAAGSRLVAACDDGLVTICDRPTAGEAEAGAERSMKLHSRRVYSVDVDRHGARLATTGEDRAAKVWDLATVDTDAAPRAVCKHPRRVLCGRFAPDSATLFTACEDRIARAWDLATGRETKQFIGHEGPVNWLAVSADGRRLVTASSDATVRLWDAARGVPLFTFRGPSRQVRKVAFTADESRVIGVGDDGAAHMWDVASGEAVCVLRGHADQVWGLAVAPDGATAITAAWDGTARVWGLSPADVFRVRCR